jgi:hypothetical protein
LLTWSDDGRLDRFLSTYGVNVMTDYELWNLIIKGCIFIISLIGLNQLWITKKNFITRNKRESIILTGSLCEKFVEKIEQYSDYIDKLAENHNGLKALKLIDSIKYESNNNKICNGMFNESEKYRKIYKLINEDSLHNTYTFMNYLEGFSLYFAQNVADEESAYYPLSKMYCEMVEHFMFLIHYCRCEGCGSCSKNEISHLYSNIVYLYSKWKARRSKQSIDGKLSKLMNRSKSLVHRSKGTSPIGTK